MALMGLKVNPESLIMGDERIRAMDEQGIDVEALSINAYWYKAERDVATRARQACRTRSSPSSARRSRTASSPSPTVALQ